MRPMVAQRGINLGKMPIESRGVPFLGGVHIFWGVGVFRQGMK